MPRVSSTRRAARIVAALAAIASIVALYFWAVPVNSTTVALTLLLAVLGIASAWGLPEAIVAALAAVLCFNYFFLPPVGTLTIADPENWVALVAFVVTAVVASQLSARARARAVEATARQHEVERLYALSRSLMFTSGHQPIAQPLIDQIARIFELPSVAFFDHSANRVYRTGEPAEVLDEARLRDAAVQGTVIEDPAQAVVMLPVVLGGRVAGSLGFAGSAASESVHRAIANLTAVAIERTRSEDATRRAEASRESQELKSAILDGVAHDFKTPLTAIKAAVTSLLNTWSSGDLQPDLLEVIDEEADRLNVMVTDAIQAARIDAGELQVRREPWAIEDILDRTLKAVASRLEGRRVQAQVPAGLPLVAADAGLVGLVLRQILDNALKYSPPGSPIDISARSTGTLVSVSVADRGPGVPDSERTRVFERLYRGHAAEPVPGTGVGLAVARQIVEAHGGTIHVENRPDGGAIFLLTLPVVEARSSS
jgi:two-component system, OmpR family, sensor histidine kinase KdpD